jgi:hypothetical protein
MAKFYLCVSDLPIAFHSFGWQNNIAWPWTVDFGEVFRAFLWLWKWRHITLILDIYIVIWNKICLIKQFFTQWKGFDGVRNLRIGYHCKLLWVEDETNDCKLGYWTNFFIIDLEKTRPENQVFLFLPSSTVVSLFLYCLFLCSASNEIHIVNLLS